MTKNKHQNTTLSLIFSRMTYRIEILGLTPTLLLSYKKGNGYPETMQLTWSLKSIMDQMKIENFSDLVGRKYDVSFVEKDGKYSMQDIQVVDDRPITYAEYEKMMQTMANMHQDIHKLMSKGQPAEKKDPQQPQK